MPILGLSISKVDHSSPIPPRHLLLGLDLRTQPTCPRWSSLISGYLDLPSIEELEEALLKFKGAILYISHDQFFCNKMGGEVVEMA